MKNQKRSKPIVENFRDFLNGAELGGSGNRYEYGANPEEEDGASMDPKSVRNMLSFINDISNTAMNVIENNKLTDTQLNEMVYVKRQIEKARAELVEGYKRLQDTVRGSKG